MLNSVQSRQSNSYQALGEQLNRTPGHLAYVRDRQLASFELDSVDRKAEQVHPAACLQLEPAYSVLCWKA